jgi:hypothetical protein
LTPRPQRPFTHASAQYADDLLLEAKELLWTQQPGKAAARLEKALTIEPNHADAMALLGKIKMVGRAPLKALFKHFLTPYSGDDAYMRIKYHA